MFIYKTVALFLLFAIAFIPLATAENQTYTNETEEEESEDRWESYVSTVYSFYNLTDWSYYNYSSNERAARSSMVRCNGKFYDPLDFKGGVNDAYAIAFHLATEVAVSAAQSRNGTLFDVAVVQSNEEYKNMMAQIQQDLKGNRSAADLSNILSILTLSRSIYYTETDWNPGWRWDDWIGIPTYKAYYHRIYNYLKYGPPPPFTPDPTPVFTSILQSLRLATEDSLGVTLNYTGYRYDKGIHLSLPWELNETFTRALKNAMASLAAPGESAEFRGPYSSPQVDWYSHSNDHVNYGGEDGLKLAQEQAIKGAEMVEMDAAHRHGEFICGNYYMKEELRIMEEMKANGTWVEPLYSSKVQVPWECKNWEECWRAWPWKSDISRTSKSSSWIVYFLYDGPQNSLDYFYSRTHRIISTDFLIHLFFFTSNEAQVAKVYDMLQKYQDILLSMAKAPDWSPVALIRPSLLRTQSFLHDAAKGIRLAGRNPIMPLNAT
ncbi:hypothetical protein B7463_g3983, partial [Scytalidium lignicola]